MNTTDQFKKTIETKLQEMAAVDPVFAKKLENPEKNIDDCITYILNTVQISGCMGFTDDEVYGMAIHYYDEEKVEIGKPVNCQVVVNHSVDLSEEERQEAREKAKQQLVNEEVERLKSKPKKKKPETTEVQQASLF